MNNRKLPFLGIGGTIKEIKENKKYFIVTRYGADKNDNDITCFTPKTIKNYNSLVEEYTKTLKRYLDNNSNRYKTYKKQNLKKELNKNYIYLLLSTGITMTLLSIPLLITHDARGYLGIILNTIAIPTDLKAIKLYIENKNNQEKQKFISSYENRKKELENMSKNISKTNKKKETKYNGLNKSNNEKIVELNKYKIKKVA
jgi:hypothetical protein